MVKRRDSKEEKTCNGIKLGCQVGLFISLLRTDFYNVLYLGVLCRWSRRYGGGGVQAVES